jgi:O-antigen/teichoic acid export membrane protein
VSARGGLPGNEPTTATSPPSLAADESPFWRTSAWWRTSAHSSVALWASTLFAFLANLVAARSLGPTGWGAVVLALAVATFIGLVLDITFEEAVVHHGARALAAGRSGDVRSLVRTAFLLDIAIGAVITFSLIAFAGPLAEVVSGGDLDPALVRLAGLSVIAATADTSTGAVLLLAGRPDLRALAMAGTSVTRLVAVLIAVDVGGPRAVLIAFASSVAAGGALQAFLAWRVGWKTWPSTRADVGVRTWARRILPFSLYSSLTTSVATANAQLVPIILGRAAGTASVGNYNVALLPITAGAVASAPLRLTLFGEQAKLAAEGKQDVLKRSIRGYTAIALAVGIPGAAIGWLVLPWLLRTLYSDEFGDAVEPARVLLVAAVAQLAIGWAKTFPAAVGRPGVRAAVSGAELAALVALLAWLAGHGPSGAAVAVSATSVGVAVTWWLVAHRLLEQPVRRGQAERSQSDV